MENKSNHVLVGGVVLTLVVIMLAFIVWLAGFSGGDDKEYDIFFKTSVDGLAKGSAVTFSGVPSGQVKQIALMPDRPEFVRVRIRVDQGVPILQGTTAQIAGVGFTGVSQINLDGAVTGAPPISCEGANSGGCPNGVPVIPTRPGALGELLASAPQLLQRVTSLTEKLTDLLSDRNQNSIAAILENVQRLSNSLAERGPEIASTLAETRIAIRQAGDAAEQIGALAGTTNVMIAQDIRPLAGDLKKTVASASKSMETLDEVLNEAKPGLQAFSRQTVPETGALIRDLREMAEALTAVAGRLDRGGAGGLIGGQKLPDYEPRK
jgi:phospholipid/cholesterol/gamma-HCH transport system substrate-binding protein